jgi:hypothetical protein
MWEYSPSLRCSIEWNKPLLLYTGVWAVALRIYAVGNCNVELREGRLAGEFCDVADVPLRSFFFALYRHQFCYNFSMDKP